MIIDIPSKTCFQQLRTLWQEAFGDTDEFLDKFEKNAFDTNRARCVFQNGAPVCALYWFDCYCNGNRIAYLYAIATAKKHRNQGYCSKLMKNTHEHLTNNGYDGAILVPGNRSLFKFYEKFGYKTCSYVKNFHCAASEDTVNIREIGVDEYKSLRRTMLPENAVIQEYENLNFLQSIANFYTGDGFLIAAKKNNNILHVTEFLGNENIASKILKSLDCDKGIFRTVGNDTPFAMYLPLSENGSIVPSYFALAFD